MTYKTEISDTDYKKTALGHSMECDRIRWKKESNYRVHPLFGLSNGNIEERDTKDRAKFWG